MGKLSLEAKVGAFVILSFLGLGVIVANLNPLKFQKAAPQSCCYYLLFRNVAGLEKDAPVRVAGVEVGRVEKIDVKGTLAEVKVIFFKPIKVYKNAKARIETMGLMGEKYIEFYPGSPPAPPLTPGTVIENTQSVASMDELLLALYETVENFNKALITSDGKNRLAIIMEEVSHLTLTVDQTVNTLNQVIEENRDALRKTLQNVLALSMALNEELTQVLDNVNSLTVQLSEMVSENREDIRTVVVNLKKVTEKLPELTQKAELISKELEETIKESKGNIQESLQDLRFLAGNLKEVSKDIKILVSKINEGNGTIGRLVNDDTLYRSVSDTAKTLGKLASKFEETKTYIGFSGDVNTKTGDTRGLLTFKVVPSEDHYYLLEVVGDSQGKVDKKYYYVTSGNSTSLRKEIERSYRLELTLQYAKVFRDRLLSRNGKFVLRGGLKESTGGVGLDYTIGKYTLFSDLWDFGREDEDGKEIPPHLRVGLKYNISDNWFFYLGGDELLYKDYRGFFLGTGLLFGDEDLKYLLTSVPAGGF
ncbi:MAG: MlaD family protein [Desulfurobacteriaceae bacterium]